MPLSNYSFQMLMCFQRFGDNYKNKIHFILTEPDLSSDENLIAQATDYIEAALPTPHGTDTNGDSPPACGPAAFHQS